MICSLLPSCVNAVDAADFVITDVAFAAVVADGDDDDTDIGVADDEMVDEFVDVIVKAVVAVTDELVGVMEVDTTPQTGVDL